MAVNYDSPEPAFPALSGVEHRILAVNGIQLHVAEAHCAPAQLPLSRPTLHIASRATFACVFA